MGAKLKMAAVKTLLAGIAVFVCIYVTAIVLTKDVLGHEGVHFGVFVVLSGICMVPVNVWMQRWFKNLETQKAEQRAASIEEMLDKAGYGKDPKGAAPQTKVSSTTKKPKEKGSKKAAPQKPAVKKGFLGKGAGSRTAREGNKWGLQETGPPTATQPVKIAKVEEMTIDDDGVEQFITSGARKAMQEEGSEKRPADSKKAKLAAAKAAKESSKSAAKESAAKRAASSGTKAAKNLDEWDVIDWEDELTKVNGDPRAVGEKSKEEKRRAEMIEMIHRDPVGMKKINDQMGFLKGKPKSTDDAADRTSHVADLKKMMADKGIPGTAFSPQEF